MDNNPALLKQLLLVEDDVLVARDMATLLEAITDDRMKVTCAANLADAKHLAQQQHFDAIITDNNFPTDPAHQPSPNGVSLIQQVRSGEWGQENAQLPIVFQSGDASHLTMQQARNAGATVCRSKTGPYDVLENFLQDVIDNRPPQAGLNR